MHSRRLLAPGLDGKPLWVRPYLRPAGEQWVAMIMADDAPPPEPGSLKGLGFFADPAEEAERLAFAYLGEGGAQNSGWSSRCQSKQDRRPRTWRDPPDPSDG